MANHNNVLKIAQELKDKSIEARAYAGLGHAARCTGDIVQAKMWHEKQLDMALMTKVRVNLLDKEHSCVAVFPNFQFCC